MNSLDLLIQHGDKITGFIVLIAIVFFYAKGLLPRLSKIAKTLDDVSDASKLHTKAIEDLKNQSLNTEKQLIKTNTLLDKDKNK